MTRVSRAVCAALAALAIGTVGAPAQEEPQAPAAPAQEEPQAPVSPGQVVATHGDWQVRCAEEQQVCVMSQVGRNPEGQEVLEVQLRKLSGAQTPEGETIPAAMQIVTPLGVLLPPGIRVQVDGAEVGAIPYQVCTPEGCVLRQPLTSEVLNRLKAGANARMTLVALPQQEIPVDISLMGFTKAFGSL